MQERGAVYGAERLERSDASAGHQQAATSTSLAPTPPTVIQDICTCRIQGRSGIHGVQRSPKKNTENRTI